MTDADAAYQQGYDAGFALGLQEIRRLRQERAATLALLREVSTTLDAIEMYDPGGELTGRGSLMTNEDYQHVFDRGGVCDRLAALLKECEG